MIRKRGEYLGTIKAPRDPEAAMAKARKVYGTSDPERARRLAVQPMASEALRQSLVRDRAQRRA